jgi:large subunit ribosomal protein L22
VARARTPVVEERQEVRAQAKWLRVAPRKARLVVEHIRGRTVPEARTVLAFTPRAAAREIEKVLASAVANAEANHGLLGDELVVSAAYVDEGPAMKRWRARARGRASRIHKRTCHVTLRLAQIETDEAPRRPRRQQAETTVPEEEPKKPARRRASSAKEPQASSRSEKPEASSRREKPPASSAAEEEK